MPASWQSASQRRPVYKAADSTSSSRNAITHNGHAQNMHHRDRKQVAGERVSQAIAVGFSSHLYLAISPRPTEAFRTPFLE